MKYKIIKFYGLLQFYPSYHLILLGNYVKYLIKLHLRFHEN